MNQTPPLLDLLGVSWHVRSAALAVAWNHHGATVACALADGMLVLADGVWQNGPTLAPRPGGGSAVVAARQPAPEPLRVRAHHGACLALRADRLGGFLTGGDDGRLVHTSTSGACSQLAAQRGHRVEAVDSGCAGMRAWASGRSVRRLHLQREDCIELPSAATALGFDPASRCLAIAHADGVTLWSIAESDGERDCEFEPQCLVAPGDPMALAWSPDGRHVVIGTREGALHGWRITDGGAIALHGYAGQPNSLAFSGDGRFLVASGAARPVAWRFDPPGSTEPPDECGITGKTPVTQVACHPSQALSAAGHHNGAIAPCQPASADVLVVKDAGQGAVTALAWSPDASRLAFGTQDAGFGWVNLPAALFRARTTA